MVPERAPYHDENREEPRIVFILGIAHRSGSTFVSDLLRLHPLSGGTRPDTEDYLLHHADPLIQYAEAVAATGWQRRSKTGDVRASLAQRIGDGIVAFLAERSERGLARLVVKTPSVRNLEHFFTLFPREYLVIVVRDGRSVAESASRSYGRPLERVAEAWARAADEIARFDEANRAAGLNYLIVRYEDLVQTLEPELRRMIRFIGLDPGAIDYGMAAELPVRGSSDIVRRDGSGLHWRPVAKTPEFQPLDRWRDWDNVRHDLFNRIAGEQLEHFGYRPPRSE